MVTAGSWVRANIWACTFWLADLRQRGGKALGAWRGVEQAVVGIHNHLDACGHTRQTWPGGDQRGNTPGTGKYGHM